MRNTLIQTIPAGATLSIVVEPPIAADERHFLVAPGGREGVVVRVINTSSIAITNNSEKLALIVFGVTKLPTIPPELLQNLGAFFLKRKPA